MADIPVVVSPWLSTTEASQYLKVQSKTLLMWARTGHVKGYALSGTRRRIWRFRTVDLDATMLAPSVAETGGTQCNGKEMAQ
jgi:excisionase family DNA binding protein